MRERRKATRYPFGAEGTVNPPQGGAGTNVVVPLISTLGCTIECVNYTSIGKKCELYFDWQNMQVGVQAQVAWRGAGKIGLKFCSVDDETRRRLQALCGSLASQPPTAVARKEAHSAAPAANSPIYFMPSSRSSPPPRSAAPYAPPRAAVAHGRRRVPRYVGGFPAHLSDPATGESSSITLTTLSVFGGCLKGQAIPEVGTKCELQTEWQGKKLIVPGEIVWKIQEQAGVKFLSLDEGSNKLLRQICGDLRLQPLAPIPPWLE